MFLLEEFEYNCMRRNQEVAARQLLECLQALDQQYGQLPDGVAAGLLSPSVNGEVDEHLLNRLACAITVLLSDPTFNFSKEFQARLFAFHRWLAAIFQASAFGNADHILRSFNKGGRSKTDEITIDQNDAIKYCLLYGPNSELRLDIDGLYEFDQTLAVSLAVGLISPRFMGTPAAHQKREVLLPWLADKIQFVDDIDSLPLGVLHDVYMHCSYADRSDKHDVKRSITAAVRRKLLSLGVKERKKKVSTAKSGKPKMLVLVEWFTSGHSIYRTHSLTIEACKDKFEVIGIGYKKCIDEITEKVFDKFVEMPESSIQEQIQFILDQSNSLDADIFYMPSVGMFPITMFAASIRIAPLQCMALGHPATTHSSAIDYVIVEEDYVGDPNCFSENLIQLPSDGMPYRPSAFAKNKEFVQREDDPNCVRIAICATTMKLNPRFLETCTQIVRKSPAKIEFHFLIGQAQGLIYPQVHRLIKQYLGDSAVVYRHQPYDKYMNVIDSCHMFINPFPFGNTNGIIDTVSSGLVGVCLTGDEVHEHIDQGIFERLGWPKWMIAKDINAYINAVVRLANEHTERLLWSESHSGQEALEKIFAGRPNILADRLSEALLEI